MGERNCSHPWYYWSVGGVTLRRCVVNRVSRVFISLGMSNASLQFIVISLQFYEFFHVASFYLCNAGLELAKWIVVRHGGRRSEVGIVRGCLSLESRSCASHMCRWS